MRKVIAAINMTLDGFCDHTAVIADDELHQHYSEVLRNAGTLLYGRVTYQLMEYWRTVVENPTGITAEDEFALIMDNTPKVVFSRTMENVDWHSARLAKRGVEEELLDLQQQEGRDILVGSPGLIAGLSNLQLIDEYHLCVHPVIAGKGLPLFKDIAERIALELFKTHAFSSGAIVLYYRAVKKES